MRITNHHPKNIARYVTRKYLLSNSRWHNRLCAESRLRVSPGYFSRYDSPMRLRDREKKWRPFRRRYRPRVSHERYEIARLHLKARRNLWRDRNVTSSFALTCESVFPRVDRILSITVARRLRSAFRVLGDRRTMQGPVVQRNGPRSSLSLGNSLLLLRDGAFSKGACPKVLFPLSLPFSAFPIVSRCDAS